MRCAAKVNKVPEKQVVVLNAHLRLKVKVSEPVICGVDRVDPKKPFQPQGVL